MQSVEPEEAEGVAVCVEPVVEEPLNLLGRRCGCLCVAEDLLAFGGGRVREGSGDELVGRAEVMVDESGYHAERLGDAAGGDLLEPFVQRDVGGRLDDLGATLFGRLSPRRGCRA